CHSDGALQRTIPFHRTRRATEESTVRTSWPALKRGSGLTPGRLNPRLERRKALQTAQGFNRMSHADRLRGTHRPELVASRGARIPACTVSAKATA
ncbi:MAG TPA: hypothetical protein VFR37_00075, partial [Longimicrobium sp.]|nr:hypothetical protein [Longimicrobium sp.]